MKRVWEKASLVYRMVESVVGVFIVTGVATVVFAVFASIGRAVYYTFATSPDPKTIIGPRDHLATILTILVWNIIMNVFWWRFTTRDGRKQGKSLAEIIASNDEKIDPLVLHTFAIVSIVSGFVIGAFLPLF